MASPGSRQEACVPAGTLGASRPAVSPLQPLTSATSRSRWAVQPLSGSAPGKGELRSAGLSEHCVRGCVGYAHTSSCPLIPRVNPEEPSGLKSKPLRLGPVQPVFCIALDCADLNHFGFPTIHLISERRPALCGCSLTRPALGLRTRNRPRQWARGATVLPFTAEGSPDSQRQILCRACAAALF